MKKQKNEVPIAYETEFYEYETVEIDEKEESDTDISDFESEISDKNDQEVILKEVEEMNNNYSFLTVKSSNKKCKKTINQSVLVEEPYLSD